MNSSKTFKIIGQRLREVRNKTGLTQAEVAKKAGLSVNYYAVVERGGANLSLEAFEAILKVLNTKSSKILPY